MSNLKIAVIYGSVRSARQGIKAARFIKNKVEERKHEVIWIDAAEIDLPMLDKMYKEYDEPESAPGNMHEIGQKLQQADAYLIVSGEYNHSVPPALKNLLDHYQKEYFFKPSAIASYSAGGFGGVRVAMHLRALLSELGMPSIPTIFPMSKVQDSFDEEGRAREESYNERILRFLDELEWYAKALKKAREEGKPY